MTARIALLSIALVVLAGAAILMLVPAAGADTPPDVPPPVDDPSLTPEEHLAQRYAPVLYIPRQSARCASDGDAMDPAPVELVLDNPQVSLRGPQREVLVQGPIAADLYRIGPDHYLDFPGNPLSPGCRYERDYLSWSEDLSAVVYANITTDENHPGIVVQYWFFYYFNDWNNKHEGDWELIQVVFEADTVEDALAGAPDRLSYAQHGGGERRDWDDSHVHRENGRPVVYVSAGSHASQYTPRVYLGKGEPGTGFGCDDATGPHRRVDPQARLLPAAVDGPGDEFAWLTFEGRWGQRLPGHNSGPTGPWMKSYYHNPLAWEEGHRSESVALPGLDAIGTQGVSFFCDAAAFSGNILLAFTDQPVLTGIAVVVVVGALVTVGIVLMLAVVRAGSSEVYGPASLREPRTLGQLIRASAHIYRLHWRTLVLLAVGLVPIGVILAAVQTFVPSFPYITAVFAVAGDRGFSAFGTVIYGYGVNLPVFAVVTVGVIAAMRQVEAGKTPDVRECYRVMLEKAGPVLFARLRALLIVILLFASIIGIPLAIYFMVRWLFIEETIVLSGSRAGDAAARSGSLVYRHWWRTFFMITVLGALGGFFTPFLVLSLVMWSPLPLGIINLVSALAYAALLPFIGIMLTFLYWDLSARYAQTIGLDTEPA